MSTPIKRPLTLAVIAHVLVAVLPLCNAYAASGLDTADDVFSMPFSVAGTAIMTLTRTGLGIGTATPNVPLQVRNGTNENLFIQAGYTVTGATAIAAVNDAANTFVPLEIHSSLTDFANGNVGIGTANPQATLDVNGAIVAGRNGITAGGACSPEGAIAYDLGNHQPVYCTQSLQWAATAGTGGVHVLASVRFSGTSCTTLNAICTIKQSYNVSSVTRISSSYEVYKIAFASALKDPNYAFSVSTGVSVANGSYSVYPWPFMSDFPNGFGAGTGTGATTTTLEIGVLANDGGAYRGGNMVMWRDFDNISVQVFE